MPYRPVVGDPLLEAWRWRTYLDLSGLDIQSIAEDANGTMWFGTANGLWSYDGFDWSSHLNDKALGLIVRSMCRHPDGSLYAGGSWGISRFSDGRWTRVLSVDTGDSIDLEDLPIKALAIGGGGDVWAATSFGALRLRAGVWTLYTVPERAAQLRTDMFGPAVTIELLPESVLGRLRDSTPVELQSNFTDICTDPRGRTWFGTRSGSVLCFTPAAADGDAASPARGTWSIYDERDGISPGAVTSILATQDHAIWLVHSASDRADVFDGQSWKSLRLPHALPALDVGEAGGRLLQTRDGVVWLSGGYRVYAYRDGEWRTYEPQDILYPSSRNVFFESTDGALWLAGPAAEIYRLDYESPRWLTLEDLLFQWESPHGAQWFLHRDGRVVVQDGGQWTSYGPEDGLIDMPVALLGTRNGEIWAAGSHEHTAAMAQFDGRKWTRHVHPQFSFAVYWKAVFESSDGSLWFGAFVDTDGPAEHRAGILQYRAGVWTHHHQPGRSPHPDGMEVPGTLLPGPTDPNNPILKFLGLGESRDGRIWAARNVIAYHDGKAWSAYEIGLGKHLTVECMLSGRDGDLWMGTREAGALRWNGASWDQFQGKESLFANSVRSLAQTSDGSIWAATDRGTHRFDGQAWMPGVLPSQLYIVHESGDLKASAPGTLWINHYTLYWMRRAWSKSPPPDPKAAFRTMRFQFQGPPPETSISTTAEEIAHPGNLAVLWSGVVPWHEPGSVRLQYSYRLDDEPWSPFASDRGHAFFTLPPGPHRLQVRARDADFNVDPTPATLHFKVLPPVWQQGWFVLLMFSLGVLVVAQTVRMVRDQARLREAHDELEARVRQRTAELELANRSLAAANRELEAFSYSVSHDLRAPLRTIDGFSRILMEDNANRLGDEGREHLQTVRAAAQRMGRLIEDMLRLARITRSEMHQAEVNLSEVAELVTRELMRAEPERAVEFTIAPDRVVTGDSALLKIALENLLGNAWKYSSKKPVAKIEFGTTETSDGPTFFVRDNGAGFDPKYASKLFGAFQRLHSSTEFPGTGIGLAIVQRVINRHGGRVWAESEIDQGATFFFTLPQQPGCPGQRDAAHQGGAAERRIATNA